MSDTILTSGVRSMKRRVKSVLNGATEKSVGLTASKNASNMTK